MNQQSQDELQLQSTFTVFENLSRKQPSQSNYQTISQQGSTQRKQQKIKEIKKEKQQLLMRLETLNKEQTILDNYFKIKNQGKSVNYVADSERKSTRDQNLSYPIPFQRKLNNISAVYRDESLMNNNSRATKTTDPLKQQSKILITQSNPFNYINIILPKSTNESMSKLDELSQDALSELGKYFGIKANNMKFLMKQLKYIRDYINEQKLPQQYKKEFTKK